MVDLYSSKYQRLNNYYNPLLTTYIKTILESALLIDEDYEVLLKASNFKIYQIEPSKLPLGLIASALTTFGSFMLAKIYDFSIIILPPLTVTAFLAISEWKNKMKRKQQKDVVDYLVKNLIKMQKLQSMIMQYAKTRNELNSELLLNSDDLEEFWKLFIEKHRQLFKVMFTELEFLCGITNELSKDFEIIKQLDVDSILNMNEANFKDCIPFIRKLQDIYIFLLSKFLNYLGITFCRNLNKIDFQQVEFLLNMKLPLINTYVDELYIVLHKEFNNVRYCTSKKIEIVNKNKKSFFASSHVSGKLHQTLTGAINNLTIIMEKLQVALVRLEMAENVNDVKLLEGALSDLRDQAFTTYESLDILCKLYGILSNSAKPPENKMETNVPKYDRMAGDKNLKTINYDDDDENEPLEENYELFIPETDDLGSVSEYKHEDLTVSNLSLMLKELRNSIKQHERFIAARHKRGIEDDEDDEQEERRRSEKAQKISIVPKFNLSELNKTTTQDNQSIDNKGSVSSVVPQVPSIAPPPPPPPLPPPRLKLYADNDMANSPRTFFDKIKTLSKQLEQGEEVFGDEKCSDSE